MTDQQTTDSPIRTLQQAANAIFLALTRAEQQGYKLVIERGWALNLTDPTDDSATPVWTV